MTLNSFFGELKELMSVLGPSFDTIHHSTILPHTLLQAL
jgi:hypothetical protein